MNPTKSLNLSLLTSEDDVSVNLSMKFNKEQHDAAISFHADLAALVARYRGWRAVRDVTNVAMPSRWLPRLLPKGF